MASLPLTPQEANDIVLTAGQGISVSGLEISNAHAFSGGNGITVSKTNDSHVIENTQPVCAFTVNGNTYSPGTVSEVIFGAGATTSISGGQLTINGFGPSGDTVAGGTGIGISLSNGVKRSLTSSPRTPYW